MFRLDRLANTAPLSIGGFVDFFAPAPMPVPAAIHVDAPAPGPLSQRRRRRLRRLEGSQGRRF